MPRHHDPDPFPAPRRGDIPRLACALLLALASPLGDVLAQGVERRTLAGSDVAIYNIAGRVRVVRGTGSDVSVEVTRRGADASRLRIETGPIRNTNTLRVIYPSARIRYDAMGRGSRTTLRVREDGTFSDDGHRGGDHGRDRVEVSGRDGLDAAADLTVGVPAGRRVRLYLAVGEVSISEVDGELSVDAAAADITASRTKGSLRVDTGSGEVRVSDASGDLDVDTGSGSVHVTRLTGGVMKIDTGSGSVSSDGVEVTRLDVDVGSGSIRLRGVRAHDLRLDSGSGDVDVALVDGIRSMVIDTGSGGVTLRLPASLGAELDVETGSGGVESEVPITVHRRSRDQLSGRIGNGAGRIRIDTGSGGVRLLKG